MKHRLKISLVLFYMMLAFANDCSSQCYISSTSYCDFPMSPIYNQTKKRVLFVDHFIKFINNDYSIGVNTISSCSGNVKPTHTITTKISTCFGDIPSAHSCLIHE